MEGTSTNKSKSQKYSQKVFENISKLVEEQSDENGKQKKPLARYKSLSKRSGGLLRTVGLIQFLTFLAAKATKPSEIHHDFLLKHLSYELNELKILVNKDWTQLIEKVQKQELPQYMRLSQEVLKLLQWHRRISEILIIIGTADQED